MNITGNIIARPLSTEYNGVVIGGDGAMTYIRNGASYVASPTTIGSSSYTADKVSFDASRSWTGATSSTGNGESHNNLPPFYSVYCWQRIS